MINEGFIFRHDGIYISRVDHPVRRILLIVDSRGTLNNCFSGGALDCTKDSSQRFKFHTLTEIQLTRIPLLLNTLWR
jgi:hypothetical protein